MSGRRDADAQAESVPSIVFVSEASTVEVTVPSGQHVVKIQWPTSAPGDGLALLPNLQEKPAFEDLPLPPPPPEEPLAPVAAVAPSAPPAAVAPTPAPTFAFPSFSISVKLAAVVPVGNAANATAGADASPTASRGVFPAGCVTFRYGLPVLDRALGIHLEAGYYRLSGNGQRAFANDPDFGPSVSFSWHSDSIPLLAGIDYRLPIPLPVPLEFSPRVGFAAVHVSPVTTYQSAASGSVSDAPQSAWALGYYLGLEGALRAGPGAVVLEIRYMSATTDLDFNRLYSGAYNRQPGDIEGTNILAGYRFAF
jgi:hypothetical protein